MTLMTRTGQSTPTLFLAFELSAGKWKLAFARELGAPPRIRNIEAGDLGALRLEIVEAKRHLGLPCECPVSSCYEAGRDGFWLHRWLVTQGIENVVVDPASIEVERRRRKRKTDRIDVVKLLNRLIRHGWGERVWSVVRIPSEEDEDARRIHRERERLIRERGQHQSRIRGLLSTQGIRADKVNRTVLELLRLADGSPLPKHLHAELKRELERLEVLHKQIKAVEAEMKQATLGETTMAVTTRQLAQLKGIGMVGAQVLGFEFFGWRRFNNGREVGALAGLTGTPFNSGSMEHEQGISKAGNRRVRAVMDELAWGWLRFQPASALSQWYERRFGSGPSRLRRIGIVALARKLLVAIWRFVAQGVVPEGALLRSERKAAVS
jgi:transposase